MNISITVGGHTAVWRFRDSDRWRGWISRRPWVNGGGVAMLRVNSAEEQPCVLAEIESDTRAVEPDWRRLQYLRLDAPSDRGCLARTLCQGFGDDGSATTRAKEVTFIARQCERPTLAVFSGTVQSSEPLQDEAERLVETVAKHECGGKLAMLLVLFSSTSLSSVNVVDLRYGYPVGDSLDLGDGNDATIWPAYVHWRVAWESGGQHGLCRIWDSKWFATCPRDGDDLLERRLNEAAEYQYTALTADNSQQIRRYLECVASGSRSRAELRDCVQRLESSGIFCRPQSARRPGPAPWLARALLADGSLPSHVRPFFRHSLVCEPLAKELLARCFELEARMRSRNLGPISPEALSPETQESFLAFQSRDAASTYRFYPVGHPSPPDQPIEFASLHEFARFAGDDVEEVHALRRLRNALAHGHYTSWACVQEFLRIRQQIQPKV